MQATHMQTRPYGQEGLGALHAHSLVFATIVHK